MINNVSFVFLSYFYRKTATDTEPTAPEPSDPAPMESPPECRSGESRSSDVWDLAAPAASSAVRGNQHNTSTLLTLLHAYSRTGHLYLYFIDGL